MNEAPPQPSPPKSKRIDYIDLLRGWAVIVMIETHMMNATLSQQAMEAEAFQWIKFINGLVAPSFLFASGLAYAVTTRRKINNYLSFGTQLYKQIRRLLFVVFIGYLLHLPKFNFHQILYETTERSWQIFFQADVL
ncbi:MAG: heparan-alpha-glucosaminide N-acetyltransferase domain-containing protein, partial [Bacteroidota bacterium]